MGSGSKWPCPGLTTRPVGTVSCLCLRKQARNAYLFPTEIFVFLLFVPDCPPELELGEGGSQTGFHDSGGFGGLCLIGLCECISPLREKVFLLALVSVISLLPVQIHPFAFLPLPTYSPWLSSLPALWALNVCDFNSSLTSPSIALLDSDVSSCLISQSLCLLEIAQPYGRHSLYESL